MKIDEEFRLELLDMLREIKDELDELTDDLTSFLEKPVTRIPKSPESS